MRRRNWKKTMLLEEISRKQKGGGLVVKRGRLKKKTNFFNCLAKFHLEEQFYCQKNQWGGVLGRLKMRSGMVLLLSLEGCIWKQRREYLSLEEYSLGPR